MRGLSNQRKKRVSIGDKIKTSSSKGTYNFLKLMSVYVLIHFLSNLYNVEMYSNISIQVRRPSKESWRSIIKRYRNWVNNINKRMTTYHKFFFI